MTDKRTERKYTLGAMKAAKRIASIHEKTVADMGIPQCPEGYRQDIIYTYAAMIDEETAAPELLEVLKLWDKGYDSQSKADWIDQGIEAKRRTAELLLKIAE